MDKANPSAITKLVQIIFREELQWVDDEQDKLSIISTISLGMEICLLVAFSHIFHMVLKRLQLPSIVSQMVVGIILGPSILGHYNIMNKNNVQLSVVTSTGRTLFMFLAGIEIDIEHLRRAFTTAAIISTGSAITCSAMSIVMGPILYSLISNRGNLTWFILTLLLVLGNTASAVLIRLASELKLTMTMIGRMAVSAALVTDIACLVMLGGFGLFLNLMLAKPILIFTSLFAIVVLIGIIFLMQYTVRWLNRRNEFRCEVGNHYVFYFIMFILAVTSTIEWLGIDSMMVAFVMGLWVPRDGPMARTIVNKLAYVVYNIIMPIYFGDAGMQTDLRMLRNKDVVLITLAVVVLGTVAKVGGTMVAAKHLGMRNIEGFILGLLLNVKGHMNLIVITFGKKAGAWSENAYMALLIAVLCNGIIACPVATYIVRRDRDAARYVSQGLQSLNLESELRILTCVHSSYDLPTILDLIEISGSGLTRVTPSIINLIELTKSITSTLQYHKIQEKDFENQQGGEQVRQVSVLLDKFVRETDIKVHHLIAISRLDTMHEDMRHAAQDLHASIVIVPFHRKRKLDGKMGRGKEEIKEFNVNVLRHSPCTVGILVDRGIGKRCSSNVGDSTSLSLDEQMLVHVVVIFLGGLDDREAASYAGRLAFHPCVNVTMVRIFSRLGQGSGIHLRRGCVSHESNSMFLAVEETIDPDEVFMSDFINIFVVSGMITYTERSVDSSEELVEALSSMSGMYSLFIVGKQTQGPLAHLTIGMSELDECPELGCIGDMLASSDLLTDGSVLVIHQRNSSSLAQADQGS